MEMHFQLASMALDDDDGGAKSVVGRLSHLPGQRTNMPKHTCWKVAPAGSEKTTCNVYKYSASG